jgi:hypothetical protein
MVLTIQDEEFLRMKRILLDEDQEDALRLVKSFVARLEQQSHQSLKSHLDK